MSEPAARHVERVERRHTDSEAFLGYLVRKLEERLVIQDRKLDVLLALVAGLLEDPDLSPEDRASLIARLKGDTKKILHATTQLETLASTLDSTT